MLVTYRITVTGDTILTCNISWTLNTTTVTTDITVLVSHITVVSSTIFYYIAFTSRATTNSPICLEL